MKRVDMHGLQELVQQKLLEDARSFSAQQHLHSIYHSASALARVPSQPARNCTASAR